MASIRVRRSNMAAALGFLSLVSAVPNSLGQDGAEKDLTCATYASCDHDGNDAMRHGRVEDAIKLFERQVALAEIADIEQQQAGKPHHPYELAVPAYNNLASACLKKHDYLQARSWALVALRWDKDNSAAHVNIAVINRALRRPKWPNSPTGEYIQYAGRATWQSIVVEPSSPGTVHFCFSGLWWGLGEGPAGLGDLRGTIYLSENRAKYVSSEFGQCVISMRFFPDRVELKQTGSDSECGFGHNVRADGTFQRISTSASCTERQE